MEKGQKFELKTFNGKTTANKDCCKNENYWQLISTTGTLVNFAHELNFPNENRVLIQFDVDVKAKGLECHNEIPNALWILTSDLSAINIQ
ncbi:MAG: hypothetical protein ABJF11_06790 [Reichenbachiella sp.]|uniref:hypothetical protein n=1 Tax=Reichenbachiella sp. TaxID=2184521 RepID=UPI003263BFEC